MLMNEVLFFHTMNNDLRPLRLFALEIDSLTQEGYIYTFASNLMGGAKVAKLRHTTNGNIIVVSLKNRTITLKKNGKIIKQYEV